MGLSMALPGLSGGTMAFVMGIYEKLLEEINKFQPQKIYLFYKKLYKNRQKPLSRPQAKKPLFQKALWFLNKSANSAKRLSGLRFFALFSNKKTSQSALFPRGFLSASRIDWAFLIPLAGGIIAALVLFVGFMPPFIKNYSIVFYSMVSGLILASLVKPFKEACRRAKTFALFFLALALGAGLFSMSKGWVLFSGEVSSWLFMLAGFLVAGALIVPGISGSYLLVILGLYEKLLVALKEMDILITLYFAVGAVAGVFLIAGGIYKMIKNYFFEMSAVLSGLVFSSLYVIFPLAGKPYGEVLSFDFETRLFALGAAVSFIVFIGLEFLSSKEKT